MDWSFLLNTMESLGFGNKWISWIRTLLQTMRASILINACGSPTKEFSPKKELRQRDLLSPILFDIVGEVFSLMMERAKHLGLIKGVSFNHGAIEITHLQFAYDTIIFLQQNEESINNCQRILQCFQLTSGLKINMQKNFIYARGVEEERIASWASIFGCSVGSFPFSYLGAPI